MRAPKRLCPARLQGGEGLLIATLKSKSSAVLEIRETGIGNDHSSGGVGDATTSYDPTEPMVLTARYEGLAATVRWNRLEFHFCDGVKSLLFIPSLRRGWAKAPAMVCRPRRGNCFGHDLGATAGWLSSQQFKSSAMIRVRRPRFTARKWPRPIASYSDVRPARAAAHASDIVKIGEKLLEAIFGPSC